MDVPEVFPQGGGALSGAGGTQFLPVSAGTFQVIAW